jgi:catechol 2,3-dioxygenase-like lactoylglutathione lyase family enzyme
MKSPFYVVFALVFQSLVCAPVAGQSANENQAPPGVVLRPGHLGRQTGDLERIIHFYHDLLGLGLRGERRQPLPFWSSPGLIEFAATPEYAEFRAVIMPIPGTVAVSGSGMEMTVEAIEFRNMERHQYVPALHDIGSSHLILVLRDLDSTLDKLKAEGVPVITAGGMPVAVPALHGSPTPERAVIVRDPDGYPVELTEPSPPPATTAPADSNILGARVSLTVQDLDSTRQLYRDLIGPELQLRPAATFSSDAAYNQLGNTPGAEFRYSAAIIPGSPVILEFIQYRNIEQRTIKPRLQDIGVAHLLFMVKDMDVIMARLQAAGLRTLAASGKPVFIAPQVQAVFVTDTDNFFVEFMHRAAQ